MANKPIQFGGQIADHIQMKLTGVGCRIGARPDVQPLPCLPKPGAGAGMAMAAAAVPTVEEVLAANVRSTR